MEPVRLGIIGCGVIGQTHVAMATARSDTTVVAVADVREDVGRDVAARFGVDRVYGSGTDLLADPDIEAVVLALPARERTPLALQAFAHGKHVLTEKPVARNASDVEQMIAARGDLVAGCCSSRMRTLPSARVVTDLLAREGLGRLRVVRCRAIVAATAPSANHAPAWRLSRELNGGGILVNWGSYDLDYLLGITGWTLRPQTVLAQSWNVPPNFASRVAPDSDAETHIVATVRCADDIVLTYERGEYVAAAAEASWQVIGDEGSLRLRMTPGKDKTIWHDRSDPDHGTVSTPLWQGDEDYEMTHSNVLGDFAAAIREHRQPLTSLEQALTLQRLTDAIYTSADTGSMVEM